MKNAWMTYDETKIKEVMNLSDDYMAFLSKGKTERKCVSLILEEAKKHGYKDINEIIKNKESLKPQDKVYMNMMNKSVALMHIGNRPIEEGMNILGAHIDSPRLDLKQNPLYEDGEIGYPLLWWCKEISMGNDSFGYLWSSLFKRWIDY